MNIDFDKIPDGLKNILSMLIMSPFWYISIFVFGQNIYKINDPILIASICICLSLLGGFLGGLFAGEINIEKDHIKYELYIGLTFQMLFFSGLFVVCFLVKKYTDNCIDFHGFAIFHNVVLCSLYIIMKNIDK